jgi:hypothetical protein
MGARGAAGGCQQNSRETAELLKNEKTAAGCQQNCRRTEELLTLLAGFTKLTQRDLDFNKILLRNFLRSRKKYTGMLQTSCFC